ncbi:MAG: phosphomethylpyrimidine synthase ThiC, partial [Candidatus Baldrarchaeia archaeon]
MTTQMKAAKAGRVTEEMKLIAEIEDVPVEWLRQRVAKGTVIIPRNMVRENVKIVGIGEGLTTKVNVNIGTSTLYTNLDMEIEKAKIAIKYGT